MEKVTSGFNNGQKTVACFFDLQAAFDKVSHAGLILKLIIANTPFSLVKILNSFLSDRVFNIKINTAYSDPGVQGAWILQGSILSPILFNLYTRDIPTDACTKLFLFADDSTLICQSRNVNLANAMFQCHLNKVREWCDSWHLKVNPSKCARTLFTRVGKAKDASELFWGFHPIPKVNKPKFLGVVLDERMWWEAHADQLIDKVRNDRPK